ncbi:biotin-dependent carboxyltransferase family protein [Neobacillus sp. LXY-4]|uniref:5-oxoprolinase subunit C family protein n=1 Tax=Neobacillus sp. LXY-4 TaxID=3379826 RepID=UPI003EDEBA85
MITIHKPGLLSSIQDQGRYGFQKFGVVVSGAMDPLAHRIANLLIGNDENAPALEITMIGSQIEFHQDSLISVCGGDLSPEMNGTPIKCWRPILVKKGSFLEFSSCKTGSRAYLAVAGGFKVKRVMNSTSTYFRGKIGGFNGRALKKGDQIAFDQPNELSSRIFSSLKNKLTDYPFITAKWMIESELIPNYTSNPLIRVMKGRQFHWFEKDSQAKLYSKPFVVTPQSDRMGYRLKGSSLALEVDEEMLSEAVSFGTIQVPADGNPIILLADRQTTGGYPKIAQVALVDLPIIAQAKPGDSLRFVHITHSEAQLLYIKREQKIQQLKLGIKWNYR